MSRGDLKAPRARATEAGDPRIATVVLVVNAASSPRRSGEIMRWVRALLPAALIMVSSAPIAAAAAQDDVITVNVDDVDAGPLAVAAALARPRGGRG